MTDDLTGKRIALLFTEGVEQVELTTPRDALTDAGADVVLLAPSAEPVQAVNGDIHPGDTFKPDDTVADADADTFDALVLPGGTANPDRLRLDEDALEFISAVAGAGKPVAAICHGPWTLVETGLVKGKTLTSFPSIRTDVENAGGTWVDQESVTCSEEGFTLVTSRKPDDLDAFVAAAIEAFAAS
jgi:deglycase